MISALHALAYLSPNLVDDLPPDMIAMLASSHELALRPEQRVPRGNWRSYGYLTGRGYGKTHAIACEIHRRVAEGECTSPALIAPTKDRVREVQVAALLDTAPLWCACEEYLGGVKWANGVFAEPASAEVERPSSGSNFDLVWMTEIVRWSPSVRRKAFDDITTACRIGAAQYLWDTTSSGKNDVIQHLLAQHDADPAMHRIVRGTLFDNPILSRTYVLDEARKYGLGTRRYEEEVLGLVFAEAAGALWKSEWIDPYRAHERPSAWLVCVLGLDPALSGDQHADMVGFSKAYRTGDGHIYLEDFSARMSPEEYAALVVRECQRDASGVVVERNHVGQHARDLIKVHARLSGMRIELLPDTNRSFPPRRPGTVFVREVVSSTSKATRAAPAAALYVAGLVHHIGELAQLEYEQCTWEPGVRRSPNALDAAVFAITELADIAVSEPRDTAAAVRVASRAAAQLRERGGSARRFGL